MVWCRDLRGSLKFVDRSYLLFVLDFLACLLLVLASDTRVDFSFLLPLFSALLPARRA